MHLENNGSDESTNPVTNALSDEHPNAVTSNCDGSTFTILEEWKYAHCYREGYDLPDKYCKYWVRVNHPEHFRRGSKSV